MSPFPALFLAFDFLIPYIMLNCWCRESFKSNSTYQKSIQILGFKQSNWSTSEISIATRSFFDSLGFQSVKLTQLALILSGLNQWFDEMRMKISKAVDLKSIVSVLPPHTRFDFIGFCVFEWIWYQCCFLNFCCLLLVKTPKGDFHSDIPSFVSFVLSHTQSYAISYFESLEFWMKKDRTLWANLLDALAKAKGAATMLAVPKYWGTENVQRSTFGTHKNNPNPFLF